MAPSRSCPRTGVNSVRRNFVGLSGLDARNWGAHIGSGNVQLQSVAVPEPSVVWLLGAGLAGLALRRFRRA